MCFFARVGIIFSIILEYRPTKKSVKIFDCREIGNSGNSAKPEIEDVFAQQMKLPVFVEEVEARREEIVEQVDAIVSGA